MYHQVKAYVARHHMLENSDRVIVGVSGGADSICLLFVLLDLKEELGFSLQAVHVHHGIRGSNADADAKYVGRICAGKQVELKLYREDVRAYAKARQQSLEEAGRDVRRHCFQQALGEYGGTKIALAHHQNDNAETMLWNLCRGTGLKGLGGMQPKNGMWIRPLLCVKRADIESYLKERGISYCTDETNLEDDYTRNKIRNHIIPYMEQEINAQSVSHMAGTMEQLQLLQEYISTQTEIFMEKSIRLEENEGILLLEGKYQEIPQALKQYVLHYIIRRISAGCKNIESVHLKNTAELMEKQVGRRINLPYSITAKRCYEGILFKKTDVVPNGDVPDHMEQVQMKCRIFNKTVDMGIFPESPYTKWFDYDIIENTVKMRHKTPGDYISIDNKGRTQKLKQFFINMKIPQIKRDRIWVVADGSHIMWIVGYRQNQMYQITEQTTKILEIEINGGEDDGGNG